MSDMPLSAPNAPRVDVAPLRSKPHCPLARKPDVKLMSNAKTGFILGLIVVSGLLAGCAWDNSPPPYHSVISYDPSRAQTFVATTPNTPSTSDWKTNQISGVGYGSAASYHAPPAAQAVGGAVSTPSGITSGGATGTSPTSGTPGAIIGSPPSSSIIGVPNSPTLPGPITTSPSISTPQQATIIGPSSTLSTPTTPPQYPGLSTPTPTGFGPTNTGSGVLFTNTFRAPTNSFTSPSLNPGLTTPRP
jgi:hypothetical protein